MKEYWVWSYQWRRTTTATRRQTILSLEEEEKKIWTKLITFEERNLSWSNFLTQSDSTSTWLLSLSLSLSLSFSLSLSLSFSLFLFQSCLQNNRFVSVPVTHWKTPRGKQSTPTKPFLPRHRLAHLNTPFPHHHIYHHPGQQGTCETNILRTYYLSTKSELFIWSNYYKPGFSQSVPCLSRLSPPPTLTPTRPI